MTFYNECLMKNSVLGFTRSSALMGFDICVLWQAVSLINLKMKRMLAFEKRYLGAIPRRSYLHAMVRT